MSITKTVSLWNGVDVGGGIAVVSTLDASFYVDAGSETEWLFAKPSVPMASSAFDVVESLSMDTVVLALKYNFITAWGTSVTTARTNEVTLSTMHRLDRHEPIISGHLIPRHLVVRASLEQKAVDVFGRDTLTWFDERHDEERVPPDYTVAFVYARVVTPDEIVHGERLLVDYLLESLHEAKDEFVIVCHRRSADKNAV